MKIIQRDQSDPELTALIEEAVAELRHRYDNPEGEFRLGDGAMCWVAEVEGLPAGCVAFERVSENLAEMRRLFVRPEYRGNGVASALVGQVEAAASGLGYATLRLETGTRQPEAMALYEKLGYLPTEPFGDYADSPLLRCYAKGIG